MDEDIELKKYKEPVHFFIEDEHIFSWVPIADTLDVGTSEDSVGFVTSIEKFISAMAYQNDGETINATPEGPNLPGTTKNLYTVIWALNTLYGDLDIKVEGDAPTMADMGLDEASNFDEDGNPIVR